MHHEALLLEDVQRLAEQVRLPGPYRDDSTIGNTSIVSAVAERHVPCVEQSARVERHAEATMQSKMQDETRRIKQRPKVAYFLLVACLVLAASIAAPGTSAAAEVKLSGSGTFKPPSAEQLAALPADLGFSRTDLASGNWSFSARYDDSVPDADPDPSVGRYAGAIHAFRLVIGGSTLDLPLDRAQIVISDGGGGFPNRESIRVEAQAVTSSGILRLSWVQVNQQAKGADLRGPAGVLPGDALPAHALIANLATASPFDRFLELRIDRPGGDPRPLLYLSSSKLSATAGPATAP